MASPSPEQFEGLINSAVNHEAKLLTLGVIAVHAPKAFSQKQIYQEVMERQGLIPVWRQGVSGPIGYCENSLEPIGCLVQTTVPGHGSKQLKAFRANEFGASAGLAATGAMCKWSLDASNPSLQQIFGKTGARSGAASRAPMNRLRLLETVAFSADEWVSYPEIDKHSGIENPRKIVREYFSSNGGDGIYEIESRHKDYDPVIEILRLELLRDREESHTTKIMQALAIYAQGSNLHPPFTIRLSDMVNAVVEHFGATDADRIRRSIVGASKRGLSKGSPFRYAAKSHGNLSQDDQCAVRIKPEYLDTMCDFLERTEAIRLGQGTKSFHATAQEILDSPDKFAFLMEKARANSPNHLSIVEPERMTEEILSAVLASSNAANVTEIKAYLFERKVPHSTEGIRQELKKLTSQGKLEVMSPSRQTSGLLSKPTYRAP